jgi:hypothetical protein
MTQPLEPDPTLGQPAEAIHMPEPSYMPAVLAFGVMATLVGILTGLAVLVIGLIIVLVTVVRWIGFARDEIAELPLEHSSH